MKFILDSFKSSETPFKHLYNSKILYKRYWSLYISTEFFYLYF